MLLRNLLARKVCVAQLVHGRFTATFLPPQGLSAGRENIGDAAEREVSAQCLVHGCQHVWQVPSQRKRVKSFNRCGSCSNHAPYKVFRQNPPCGVAQVLEETGVRAKSRAVIAIRQAHTALFGKSDLFAVVALE